MEKSFYDELYHSLRVFSNYLAGAPNIEARDAVKGIADHLLTKGGDYGGLLKYLDFYNRHFVAPRAIELFDDNPLPINRFVDIGAGLGWFGRAMSFAFNVPSISVDKRQFSGIDIVADIESSNGLSRVKDALKPNDMLLMSEFIHCVDDPVKILHEFAAWPVMVIEYYPNSLAMRDSYNKQIRLLGAKAVDNIETVFAARETIATGHVEGSTHQIWLLSKE